MAGGAVTLRAKIFCLLACRQKEHKESLARFALLEHISINNHEISRDGLLPFLGT